MKKQKIGELERGSFFLNEENVLCSISSADIMKNEYIPTYIHCPTSSDNYNFPIFYHRNDIVIPVYMKPIPPSPRMIRESDDKPG